MLRIKSCLTSQHFLTSHMICKNSHAPVCEISSAYTTRNAYEIFHSGKIYQCVPCFSPREIFFCAMTNHLEFYKLLYIWRACSSLYPSAGVYTFVTVLMKKTPCSPVCLRKWFSRYAGVENFSVQRLQMNCFSWSDTCTFWCLFKSFLVLYILLQCWHSNRNSGLWRWACCLTSCLVLNDFLHSWHWNGRFEVCAANMCLLKEFGFLNFFHTQCMRKPSLWNR